MIDAYMGIQEYIVAITQFLNNFVIPTIFALAFLFFIVNVARYFIMHGSEDEGRKSARQLAIYGIITFVITLSIWGIVNLLLYSLGISGQSSPRSAPDYMQSRGNAGGSPTGGAGVWDPNDGYVDPGPDYQDNDAGYQLPGQYQGGDNAGGVDDVPAFNVGGSPI